MNIKTLLVSAIMFAGVLAPASVSAFDLSSLLGNGTLTNLIEGVLTKTDISVADMAGTWTIDGSAVSFKSENALAKAGGVAIAATVESKIDPYFKQYGLTGGTFKINQDGTFSMSLKGMTVNGTIEKLGNDGTFDFKFKVLGMSIANLTTYVQKSPSKLEILFDATKLKTLLSALAKFSGSSLANTAIKLLDQYEGLCVGFGLVQTAPADNDSGSGSGFSLPSILKSKIPGLGGGGENDTTTKSSGDKGVQNNDTKTKSTNDTDTSVKSGSSSESGLGNLLEKLKNKVPKNSKTN